MVKRPRWDLQLHRKDIDGLRAYAVIPVVLFHVGAYRFRGGFVGVDVFFVISGFLITRLILEQVKAGEFSLAAFYGRRIRRLFPALWVTILLSMIAAFLLLSPTDFQSFGGSALYSIIPASNIWFWSDTGYWSNSKYAKPLLNLWSLGVEEQFYLFWPAFLIAVFAWLRKWMSFTVLLASVASLAAAQSLLANHPDTVFYWMPFRIFEFGIGAALLWLPQLGNRAVLIPLLLSGLGLIAAPVLTYTPATPFPGATALVPCLGAALAIYAGQAPFAGRLLDNPLALGIGKISYSLYLVHWPIIIFWRYYTFRVPAFQEKIGLIAASLLVAMAMYFFVEQPFRRGKRLSLGAFAVVSAGLAVLVALPAHSIFSSGGWEWRLPPGRTVPQYGGIACPSPYCFAPGEPGKEFVVSGDSYGRMYYAGLLELADGKFPFSVFYFEEQCRFFNVQNRDNGYDCGDRLKAHLDYIRDRKIETLVVAYRWMAIEPPGSSQPGESPEARRARFITDRFQELLSGDELKSVSKVIFVLNSPEQDFLNCEPTPAYLGERDCGWAPISDFAAIQDLNAEIRKAVSGKNLAIDLKFIDPFDQLCDGQVCYFQIGGQSLFNDRFHLSELGARYAVRRWPYGLL
jgi:peptidoglycan/LPS O-acetylase OafA/YrhL